MIRGFILVALVISGCSAPAPSKPLSNEHEKIIREAIAAAGFASPSFVGLEIGVVEIQYHIGGKITPDKAEHLAMGAVKAARNALYVSPDADKSWRYNVSVWNPAPGPDMDPIFIGSAYMSNNLYRWSPA